MESDPNNMILNNFQMSNGNNITSDYPSHEVSLNEQLNSGTTDINFGQDNLFSNSANVVDYSNQIGENLTQNTLTTGVNQEISNITTDNFNALGNNISGAIPQTSENVDNLDFLKATSEQYPTEESPNINTPNIFTSKLLDDTQKFSSSNFINPTNAFGDNNATYSIGKTEELNSTPITENLVTTTGDFNLPQNQILHSATTTNIETNISNNGFSEITDTMNIPTEPLKSEIKTSNIQSAGKKLDLSDPKVIELVNRFPKVAELVKKYRTELVVEPKEEVKYVPVKKVRYVKKLKVYVPTIKKVFVPGKKVVVPIKKKVYVPRPKNVNGSQMSSQISTSTNPVMMTSSYSNPYTSGTNSYNISTINKMTQSVNSVNNSQMFGVQSINPSMSLVNPNVKPLSTSTNVIEIPLGSSTSSTNILHSPMDLKNWTGKSIALSNSYNPRVNSHSLPKNNINNLNNYNYY